MTNAPQDGKDKPAGEQPSTKPSRDRAGEDVAVMTAEKDAKKAAAVPDPAADTPQARKDGPARKRRRQQNKNDKGPAKTAEKGAAAPDPAADTSQDRKDGPARKRRRQQNADGKRSAEKAVPAGKVVTINTGPAAPGPSQAPAPRSIGLRLSFVMCVVLPLILAGVYYEYVATDRYASRAGFSIRGLDTSGGVDAIGALTGLGGAGSTTADSYIILSYLNSRELLEAVDEQRDLSRVYASPEIDWLSRLSPDATVEEFLRYWNRRIHTQFDPTSGIIEFEVQSFSADHARDIAQSVLELARTLVNELSANARSDTLRFAREEVVLQETRLRQALADIRDFRSLEQSVDPSASAALEIQLIANLQAQLIDINARISVLRQTLDENAPSLVALRRNAEALEAQIAARRQAIGSGIDSDVIGSDVTEQLARFEELEVDRNLAQQAYASALASLEQARRDADRQQRYLAIHMRPQVAEAAEYPRGIRNMLIVAFALISAWGIGTLLTFSVRDHLT